jgi:hypothetical protein
MSKGNGNAGRGNSGSKGGSHGGSKGNGGQKGGQTQSPNWPSKTGGKSGSDRDNAPPAK